MNTHPNVGYRLQHQRPASLFRHLRYKVWKSKARAPLVWLRHRNFRPADTFFAAYPRSGSTWSRFVLFEILTGREAGFDTVNATIRGPGGHKTAPPLLPGGGRFIGTHEPYRNTYKRAIYNVRDGRDVLLSEYAFVTALGRFHGTLDDFITIFLRGKVNGYGTWHNHVRSWLDSPIAQTSNLLIVRFDNLRSTPEHWFKRIAEFLGVDADPLRIRNAIANNSLDQMRAKEARSPQKSSAQGHFVRQGTVQGWRNKLTAAQLARIDETAGDILARLEYPLSTQVYDEPVLTVPHRQATVS